MFCSINGVGRGKWSFLVLWAVDIFIDMVVPGSGHASICIVASGLLVGVLLGRGLALCGRMAISVAGFEGGDSC